MRKFVINMLIFFGIVAAVDFAAGKVLWHLQTIASGRTGAEYYACKESNEEVIIMGSSRAQHHYVPQIISDSLKMSCFNAGQDGNGIIMQYGRWKMISERYSPKLVIYDITTFYDLDANDNMTYIDRLKPFCDDYEVKQYVASIFPLEKIKLCSRLYRYNYKFLEMASDCLREKNDDNRGYFPLYGEIKQEAIKKDSARKDIMLDEVKLCYLEQLAKDCATSNTKLVFAISPTFNCIANFNEYVNVVLTLAERYGAQFLDYHECDLSLNQKYFKDSQHLNDEGARKYTSELLSVIEK